MPKGDYNIHLQLRDGESTIFHLWISSSTGTIIEKETIVERENILKRDLSTNAINKKWVGDITYIHTFRDGWSYLASVMDLHTKKIVGYSFSRTMTTDLIIKALENAYHAQYPDEGLIFHSDLGTQYTSTDYGLEIVPTEDPCLFK